MKTRKGFFILPPARMHTEKVHTGFFIAELIIKMKTKRFILLLLY